MTALPPEGNAFDLAFEPLIEIKGPVTEKVSTFDVLMRRRYREALEGKVDAIKVMLNVIRHDARFRAEANGPHRTRIVREGASGIVPATPAMRLLDIARPMGLAGRIGIAPWVAALVRQRLGDRAVDACREYLCDPVSSEGSCSEDGAKPVERYSLHDDPDYYIPPKASAPQATWFPKGKSGNPAGRPPRRDIDVPFGGFLQGMVAIKIEGQERTVTRLEALVYQLQVKALNGDASVSRLLVEAGVAEHLDRWRRRPEVMRIVYEGSRGLGEDPFVCCLQDLRLLNRRTRKHALLEPWIVMAALARLDRDALNEEEQAVVVRSTSTPHKVNWPGWWSPALRKRQRVDRRQPRVRTRKPADEAW